MNLIRWIYAQPCIFHQTPCTGRGPINSTLSTLAIGYDEAIWQLLCLELDRYVRVESIDGVPHYRLENIPAPEMGDAKDKFPMRSLGGVVHYSGIFGREQFKLFIKYLLEHLDEVVQMTYIV